MSYSQKLKAIENESQVRLDELIAHINAERERAILDAIRCEEQLMRQKAWEACPYMSEIRPVVYPVNDRLKAFLGWQVNINTVPEEDQWKPASQAVN